MIQPTEDRVLIKRIESRSALLLTDKPKSIKGIVLAVGPGKWVPGTWWKTRNGNRLLCAKHMQNPCTTCGTDDSTWKWFPSYREQMEVKPGDLVAFNSRWNDLAHAENKGTGADFSGTLERPLSYKLDPLTHLVREADIFGILQRDCRVEYIGTAIEANYFKNGQVEPPDSSNAIDRSTGLRF